jgi:hypothetical protein
MYPHNQSLSINFLKSNEFRTAPLEEDLANLDEEERATVLWERITSIGDRIIAMRQTFDEMKVSDLFLVVL